MNLAVLACSLSHSLSHSLRTAVLVGLLLAAGAGSSRAQGAGFLENQGQWSAPATFRLERGGTRTWLTPSAMVVDLGARSTEQVGRGWVLGFELLGASPESLSGESELPGRHNFFLGQDGERWLRGVPSFERIRYSEAWPGIDLVAREGDGAFEYDLELAAGADLAAARIEVSGGLGLQLEDGALVISTGLGELRQAAPVSWCVSAEGNKTPVESRFVLLDERTFGFEVEGLPSDQSLVVDPGFEWSTYLGAFDEDIAEDVEFTSGGDVVVTGTTWSYEFPVTRGAYDSTINGARDAFVTRLAADGKTLVFSTLLGGTADDWGVSLAVGAGDEIWACGDTDSVDFPGIAGGFDTGQNGGTDVFVVRLDSSGSALLGSTFYGGSGTDRASEVALTSGSEPVLVGWSDSSNLPVSSTAFDTAANGARDGLVIGLTGDLAGLSFASYLGGSGNDMARAVALGAGDEIFVGGLTSSGNFPAMSGSFDPTHNPGSSIEDGFVLRLAPGATGLSFSTFYGGTASDSVEGIALGPTGSVWVVGTTESSDLPLGAAPYQGQLAGAEDGFISCFSASGSSLLKGTFFGGSDRDRLVDLRVDGLERVAAVGVTQSGDLPSLAWVFDRTYNSPAGSSVTDAFVVRMEATGGLDYCAYLGGIDEDFARAMAQEPAGGVVVVGGTNSVNYPTTFGSWDTSYDLSYIYDGFVTRFDFSRYPTRFGTPKTNSMSGWAVLDFGGFPSLSGSGFSLYLEGGIPFSQGLLFWSNQAGGGPFMGGDLLMAPPFHRGALLPLDWFGSTQVDVQIDALMVGTTRYYQAWYLDPADAWGIGLSDAIEVRFYP